MSDESHDSKLAYESPDAERPATAAPTEPQLEEQLPIGIRPAHDPYAALRFPDYRWYCLGWMISVVGQLIQSTAFAWEIFDRTGSKLALGWVAGVQAIPVICLALPGGYLADRFDRRLIVTLSALLASAGAVALALLSYKPGSVPWMFLILLLSSSALTLGRPARFALLPQIVPPAAFSNAVAWNSSIFQVAAMSGPAVGGAIIHLNTSMAYMADAICAAVFGLLMLRLRKPRAVELTTNEPASRHITAGVRFVWSNKIILATLTLDLFAVLLGGAVYLLPVFAKEILNIGSIGFGWLRAAEAIGAFCMAMLIAHLPPMKHAGRSMLLAVAVFGVCTIVFGLSKSFWLSFAMLFLIGAMDNISVVVRHTLVQLLTPDSMRGRVSAVNNIFIGASNELGGLESGLLAAAVGPVKAVVIGGIGTLLVVLTVAWKWPHLRKIGALQDVKPVRTGA